MNYLLYNNTFYPELPEWTKEYAYVAMYKPNLSSEYILAFNEYIIQKSSNSTYGVWHDTSATSGVQSVLTSGVWGKPTTATDLYITGESPYRNDHSTHAFWCNKDIYCLDDNDVEYVILKGTEPIDPTPPDIVYPYVPIDVDKNSFLLGNMLRRIICGEVDPRKPKYYQYNSVKLPIITLNYDKHKYPYCMVRSYSYSGGDGTYYDFYAFSYIEYSRTSTITYHHYNIRCYDYLHLRYDKTNKKWEDSFTRYLDAGAGDVSIYTEYPGRSNSVVWSNFTVTNRDGSLTEPYIPTPVY